VWEGVGIDTSKPRIPQLAAAVRAAAPEGAERVLVGTTGLGVEDTAAALLEKLSDHGTSSVYLAHDSVTSYLGALGDRTGCVVAAGTGVVTLGVGATRAVRVDGWGWILGDAGSGFWIGRRAIDMALRAFDGRGPSTGLLDLVRADFGDPALAYLILQADPGRVARTAA
jgi:glucosamine kinase